jgi:hypothetical protein
MHRLQAASPRFTAQIRSAAEGGVIELAPSSSRMPDPSTTARMPRIWAAVSMSVVIPNG